MLKVVPWMSNLTTHTRNECVVSLIHGDIHFCYMEYQTASQALGDWYFERSTSNSVIDCPYPCNSTCKPPTRGILTFGRPSFRNWSKRGWCICKLKKVWSRKRPFSCWMCSMYIIILLSNCYAGKSMFHICPQEFALGIFELSCLNIYFLNHLLLQFSLIYFIEYISNSFSKECIPSSQTPCNDTTKNNTKERKIKDVSIV